MEQRTIRGVPGENCKDEGGRQGLQILGGQGVREVEAAGVGTGSLVIPGALVLLRAGRVVLVVAKAGALEAALMMVGVESEKPGEITRGKSCGTCR